jgi:hypothetical protein
LRLYHPKLWILAAIGRFIQLQMYVQYVHHFLQIFQVFDITKLVDSRFLRFFTLFGFLVVLWLYSKDLQGEALMSLKGMSNEMAGNLGFLHL